MKKSMPGEPAEWTVINVRALVVGMKYHSVCRKNADRLLSGQVILRREPTNIHDSNAIAVISGEVMIGYIDRETANIIAPLLDIGARWNVSVDMTRIGSSGAVPIVVRIERSIKSTQVPIICEGGVSGIYRIFIKGYGRCYIGQSVDVQHRLEQHWDELRKGVHLNPELRRVWQERGVASFQAALLEKAPGHLRGLALARWLVERERTWVQKYGGLRNTINAKKPDIVLHAEAREELERERLKHAGEVESLERRAERIAGQIDEKRKRAADVQKIIRKASVFWGLFASDQIKNDTRILKDELFSIERDIAALEGERSKLIQSLWLLKGMLLFA